MSNREDFEEAASRLGFNLTMAEHETGEYHYPVTQDAWDVWQEAIDVAAREQEGGEAVARVTVSEAPGGYCGAYVGIEWLDEDRVIEGDLLYRGRPQSQGVPEGWIINRESEDRITLDADGIGFYVARVNAERIADIMLYALANDLLLSTPATPQVDEWVKCSQRLPRIGQRVILKSKGVVQNYMPTLDQGDIDGFGGGDGYFWCFDDAIGDEDYPLVDFETDEWMPCPQPPEQGDGV